MSLRRFLQTICVLLLFAALPAAAQEHAPAKPQAAHPPDSEHPQEAEEHASPIDMIARLFNFAVLVGALVYFLKTPIANYLSSRHAEIRQELVTASEMRAVAAAQLAEIDSKMAALPGELEQLRRQGAEDVKSEQARIAQAAEHERKRLLEQTRREIDMRLRIAKRELTEHAAQLAVQVAEQRIKRSITPEDQIRLVDRYASQLREAR
jgi:F-type H+-transporting ATPase subunit b